MISVSIQNITKVQNKIKDINKRCQNPETMLGVIAEMGRRDIIDHFKMEEGPNGKSWQKLKSSTIKKKGSDGILKDKGILRNSIRTKTSSNLAIVFTNIPYAKIHNYGGQAGRHNSVNIIKREFMYLSNIVQKNIMIKLAKFLMTGQQ
jgi:phage virion morphogenesis protein